MSQSIVVLAVPHQLQGPGFLGYVDDPSYARLVEDLIADGVDFVFEEAAGRGPSTAKNLAILLLGPGRYLDVDPPPHERHKYGIGNTGGGDWINPGVSSDYYESAIVEENGKREKLWTQRVQDQTFKSGLAICGICHGLSFAFRLVSAGIDVEKSYSYTPFNKLCTRPHGFST
ncbi:MAG TPA: hypothetical protein VGS15_06895 [Candidatus Acidoferrales bacterium]|nr:hypothetical protein [Candidatus Acidoferrales bacterium]